MRAWAATWEAVPHLTSTAAFFLDPTDNPAENPDGLAPATVPGRWGFFFTLQEVLGADSAVVAALVRGFIFGPEGVDR